MKAVLQRVAHASVTVDGAVTGAVKKGFLILLGVAPDDTEKQAEYLAKKCTGMRIFEDEEGKMNRSLSQVGGGILAISQFTLFADCKKGNRPSFTRAAPPEPASRLYDYFCDCCRGYGIPVEKGIFGADMKMELLNDGPVTIILDTDEIMPR
ncbi:MAG: D-aminoacyl-tRNA deacylase [Butyricicoccaceae bacterium]